MDSVSDQILGNSVVNPNVKSGPNTNLNLTDERIPVLARHLGEDAATALGLHHDEVVGAVGEHDDADVVLAPLSSVLFLPVPPGVEEHAEGLVLLRVGPDHHGHAGL